MIGSTAGGSGSADLLVKDCSGAAAEEPDYSSVITQVTKRDPSSHLARPQPQTPVHQGGALPAAASGARARTYEDNEGRPSWGSRLLCCLSPSADAEETPPRSANPAPSTAQDSLRDVLIGPKRQEDAHKKTLVLDLDETLVHSSFKPIPSPDYIIPVEIDGKLVDVFVLKRPWLDHFMESIGNRYEVVVFTASLAKYADPLLDLLDQKTQVVRWRLFREACVAHEGNYVKDLACLGRELHDVIIVDNSPHSYALQPDNALPIGTFIDNMEDQELLDLLPVLHKTELARDVRGVLATMGGAQQQQQQQQQQQKGLLGAATGGVLAAAAGGGGGGGLPLPRAGFVAL